MRYELYYTPSNSGRGEFIRLPLEEAKAEYVDVAREKGAEAVQRFIQKGSHKHPPFVQPVLKAGRLVIGQTANILLFLGPKLGLAPKRQSERLWAHQLQLTIADLLKEIQDTHHPVAHGLYYEDQKAEALTYSRHFLAERLPKFLGYFERVTGGVDGHAYMVGDAFTYVDLSMFQLLEGLRFSFPRTMQKLQSSYPGLATLRERVAGRPNVAAYLDSSRRMAFNDKGIFRHYPELEEGIGEEGV